MDPRFLQLYSPPQPAFDFLTWDSPQMQVAREVLALPGHTDRKAFALGLQVHVRAGEISIDRTTWLWAEQRGTTTWAQITLPFGTGPWADSARAIAPLALDFLAQGRLKQDICALLSAQKDTPDDAPPDVSLRDFHGFLFVMSAGAALIRDKALLAVKDSDGRQDASGAIFPILPKPPSRHEHLAAIETLQSGIRLLLEHHDPERANKPEYLYRIGTVLEV